MNCSVGVISRSQSGLAVAARSIDCSNIMISVEDIAMIYMRFACGARGFDNHLRQWRICAIPETV